MSNTYQVLGTDEVITRGRDEFLQTLLNTKRHISIVAPKYFGKSVVLNEIVRKTVHRSPDTVVFYMDLRKMQRNIDTDEKFFRHFCRGIKDSLEKQNQFFYPEA